MVAGMRRWVPAMAVMSMGALAMAADATTDDLKAQIDALQKKVDALEAKQVAASDVDATVQRVLEDAERRSQFMQTEGFTAGFANGKFVIQSADGNWSFSPILRLQLRYIGNWRDDAKVDGNSSYEDGFEVRRAKIGAAGNLGSKDLTYSFIWATNRGSNVTYGSSNPASGEVYLEEAIIRYQISKELSVFGGQYENFITRDEIISSGRMLAVDEAAATQLLIENTEDYVQGVGVQYMPISSIRLTAAYHDGVKSADSNFQNTNNTVYGVPTVEQFGVTGRADWMVFGDNWKQYDQYSALGAKKDLLVLGAGIDYLQSSNLTGTFDAVDALYQSQAAPGVSLYGAAMANQLDPVAGDSSFNYGFLAQAGWLFHKNWEVFGRYDIALFDNDALGLNGDDQVQEITAGVNYYIQGQTAKLTFDVIYLPQGFPQTISNVAGSLTGLGILPTNGDAQEVVARVQFQLHL